MSDYSHLLISAWNRMVDFFDQKMITFYSEADVRSHLFSNCLHYLEQGQYPQPWEIHTEITIGNRRADIILGKKDVALEIKFLRYTHATPTFQDVIKDVNKVSNYITGNSYQTAYVGIIDEKGTSKRKMPILTEKAESWREILSDKGIITFWLCEILPS